MDNKLLSVKELADRLSMYPSWIYSKTRTGEIPHYKIGKYCRFDLDKVKEWIERQNAE
jgi:excisionase family DNA binding protein